MKCSFVSDKAEITLTFWYKIIYQPLTSELMVGPSWKVDIRNQYINGTSCTLLKWHPADLVYLVHLLGVNNSDLSIKRKWFFNTQFKQKFYLDSNTAITSMEMLPPTWRADSFADVATRSCGLWLPASGSVSVVTSSPSCPLDQRTSLPFWCTICHDSNNREHECQDFKSSL